jgi:hypothetical protein
MASLSIGFFFCPRHGAATVHPSAAPLCTVMGAAAFSRHRLLASPPFRTTVHFDSLFSGKRAER